MKQIRVTEHILQLTRWRSINCFLVREDDGFTLVDTSMPGAAPAILAAARALGTPIRRILLTHAHADHVGSLDALVKATGAEAAIGRRDARLLAGDRSLDTSEPQDKVRGSFLRITSRPAVLLESGDHYGSLEAIATPGHTPGHLSFYDKRTGTLLAGDALCSVGGLRVVADAPWFFPFPRMATWHPPTALRSVQRLSEREIESVACGHGFPVTDGTRSLAAALARCAGRMR